MSGDRLRERGVTPREAEVLAAVAERLTNAEVAARLFLSERTVESHVSSLLRKLGAGNRLELGELAKALFEGDRATRPSALPAPLELLADAATFVGREHERDALRALWQRASAGHLLIGVIAGEAGIGKSRLAAELAAEVGAAGGQVLLGACSEDGGVPYEPFAQAITDDVGSLDRNERRRRIGGSATALARLAPHLPAVLGVSPPADEVFDAQTAQAEVFAALHGYFARAAEQAPLLFVVEDAHWATPTTAGALRHLARASGHAPVLVVVTTRDVPPDLSAESAALLADLERQPSVQRIDLAGLAEGEVAVLLRTEGDDADPAVVLADTGGNPLFVREASRGAGRPGSSLGRLLADRYARLEPEDVPVIDVAAVLGASFDADVIADAAQRPLAEVLDTLDRAEAAGLVTSSPVRAGRFSFAHALFRTARYDTLSPNRRLVLHHQIRGALELRAGDDRVLPELARHACLAAPLGDAPGALAHAIRAAELAERSLALREAADHYRRALDVCDLIQPPDERTRLGIAVRLGEALQGSGAPGWRSVLLDAAASARALGDPAALAEVGWAMVRYGGPSNPAATDHEFAAILQEALSVLGTEPTAARARTLAAASEDRAFTDPEVAIEMVEEARRIARQLDDPVTLAHVLLSYRFSARSPDNDDAGHPTADELIAIGHRTNQPAFTILGVANHAWRHREEGDLTAANAAIDSVTALQRDRALPPVHVVALTLFQASRAAVAGSIGEAERLVDSVWTLAGEGFDPANWYGPAILLIRHAQGRLSELVPMIELAVGQPGIGAAYRSALATGYAHAGRLDDAGALVRSFVDESFATIPRNFTWLASLVALAEAAEMVGDVDAAKALHLTLTPYQGRIADLPQGMVAPVDLGLAQTALTAGDPDAAEAHAARVVRAARSHGAVVFLGRGLVRLAEARRRKGASASVAALSEEAVAIAADTGAQLIHQEAVRFRLVG